MKGKAQIHIYTHVQEFDTVIRYTTLAITFLCTAPTAFSCGSGVERGRIVILCRRCKQRWNSQERWEKRCPRTRVRVRCSPPFCTEGK